MASEMSPVPDDLDFGVTVRGLVISQKVFGRYTLKHVLGRGGMGVVWLAVDERLEREVALKFLPEIVNFDAAALDDLKRETRRSLDLTHPNIVRIYDFVKDSQAAAISMEYIDGKTLSALRIEKEKRMFEVNEIRDWIAQACQALHYAHQDVKVVHRDLKPANLMITSRNSLKIADFGIARSVSDSVSQVTMKTGTSGTLVYMSPQQMNGDMSRVTDDIYALGATIYELLTSRPPFYSGDIPFQVRQTIPRKLSERREELQIEGDPIPQEWEDAIAACLDKMPEGRPQDTFDLADRLGLHSSGMIGRASTVANAPPAGTKPPTLKPPATKKPKPPPGPKPPRRPFPTKLVGIYVGGAAGVLLLGWLLWSFVLWPFIATPGTVTVQSAPAGATVHLSGQDRITPAVFDKVRVGHYTAIVSLAGYDTAKQPLTVTEGGAVDLGTITLNRAYGRLNITADPPKAHYELTGTSASTKDVDKEGSTPDYLASVPAGSYQLTLTSPGLSDRTVTIEIAPHATQTEKDDLIALDLASNSTSADAGKALLGQESPGSLDANGKTQYAILLKSAFAKYLAAGDVTTAAATIDKLKSAGQDTSAQDKALADKRASILKTAGQQIGELISDKKFATAQATLDGLKGQIDDASLAQLKTQYQPPLDQYAQQVGDAIRISQGGGDVNAAYAQLKSFAAPSTDDLKLQLALADLETKMPPDHDRLTARLKSFHALATANRGAVEDPDFEAMQDKFTRELSQLDNLAAALDRARNGGGSLESQLSNLEDERAETAKKAVGDAAVAGIVNGFSRAFTGRNVISQQDKDAELADYDAKIANVKQEIAVQNANSGDAVAQAQRNYDAFVARVPW
jgi:serine/threonine protein kinase